MTVAAGLLCGAPPVEAQVAPASAAPRMELGVGGVWIGKFGLGSASANLIQPGGGQLPLFKTEMSLASMPGIEAFAGFRLTKWLHAEATGSFVRGDVRTEVHDDFEGAGSSTLSESMSRFAIEGSALFVLRERAKTTIYARGGVGWMRELAQGSTLAEDGTVGNVGAGLKYWWVVRQPTRPTGLPPTKGYRMGLRVEGRGVVRSKGLPIGASSARIAPAVSGAFLFAF